MQRDSKFKLGPYQEEDKDIFYGRDKEVEEMYRSFLPYDYLVCYAASGEGKSSILNAGLFPKLRENGFFPISVRFGKDDMPWDDCNIDFDAKINNVIDETIRQANITSYVIQPLLPPCDEKDLEWQYGLINKYPWLRLRYSQFVSENFRYLTPVLIFDQFEEVYKNPKSEAWTKHFFSWLEMLSKDTCPEHIIEIIRQKKGEKLALPDLSSTKKFKAIFSQRAEFIANLDYWGVQRFFIPDLKNNRFFLKSLTTQGASEVVKKGGLDSIGEDNVNRLVKGCANDFVEGHPCVPAYILSVACSMIEKVSEDEKRQQEIIIDLERNQEKCIEKLLTDFYLHALEKCGIQRNSKEQDILEAALFDDDGNRKPIAIKDEQLLGIQHKIDDLIKPEISIIRVVSGEGKDRIIEFAHDRLKPVIKLNKERRMQELLAENKRQTVKLQWTKEWIRFGCITAIQAIVIYSAFKLLDNKEYSFYLELPFKYPTTFQAYIFKWNVEDTILKSIFKVISISFDLILNWVVLTALCTTTFKWDKVNKCITTAVSVFGFISFTLLFIRNLYIDGLEFEVHLTTILGGVFSLCALLTIIGPALFRKYLYGKTTKQVSIKQPQKEDKPGSYLWPLYGGLFLFSSFLFVECVINTSLGTPEHADSYWALSILPTLLCATLWGMFRFYEEPRSNVNLIYKVYIGISLSIVTILFFVAIPLHWELGIWKWFAIIIVTTAAWLWMWNASSNKKRRFAYILGVFSIIFFSTIFQHGFNQFEIPQQSVVKVIPWKIVYVKNTEQFVKDSTKIGVKDALTGEHIINNIISCDSAKQAESSIKDLGKMYSPKGAFDSTDVKWGNNSDNTFYHSGLRTYCQIVINPNIITYEMEQINAKLFIGCSIEDSINHYSALLYRQLRDETIEFMIDPKHNKYSIESLTAYSALEKCVHNAFVASCNELDLTVQDTTAALPRPRVKTLTDKEVSHFMRCLTQYFFLISLKDRIQKNDIVNIPTMLRTYLLIFFRDTPAFNFNYTLNASFYDETKEEMTICTKDVFSDKVFAWYYMFQGMCITDLSYNLDIIKDILIAGTTNYLKDLLSEVEEAKKETDALLKQYVKAAPSRVSTKMTLDDRLGDIAALIDSYKTLRSKYPIIAMDKDRILDKILDDFNDPLFIKKIIIASRHISDSSFKKLQDLVISTISPLIMSEENNIYYNAFATVIYYTATVAAYRGYDNMQLYSIYENAEKNRHAYYEALKIDSLITNSMREAIKVIKDNYLY